MSLDQTTVSNILLAMGGLGLFLYGMKLMGDGLELAAGSRLRKMLEKLTTNRYLGALVGLVVTGIIQSSTAVSVMVVGFVNAEIMTLSQAIGVIMGANIGTTVTSILLSFKISTYAPIAIFIGAFMVVLCKKNNHKYVGQIIAGFGILFFGMSTMSGGLEPLADSPFFKNILTSVSNPFIGILVGVIFAAAIQSSSASVGVLQALGAVGALSLPNAVYIIYGLNIGACSTAVISSIGATKAARRTAMAHVIFNTLGTMLFTIITLLTPFISWVQQCTDYVPLQISIVHIVFNVLCTVLFLPMSNLLTKLACIIIPGEDKTKEACRLKYIDSRLLQTPPIAVAQVTKEIERMGNLAKKNFAMSMESLLKKDSALIEEVEENEEVIDYLNQEITTYLVKINGLNLEDSDRVMIGSYYHVVSDMERIGDHCENICELAAMEIAKGESFSKTALNEIAEMQKLVSSIIENSLFMFSTRNYDKKMIKVVSNTEQEIDNCTSLYKENHIERLSNGECDATVGTLFMELLTNLERIADHSTNIAFSMYPNQKVPEKAQLPENTNA
ncbi:MAG: Na/Pi cotransporter family protein [Clostridia bacterium]|nr:Na/Pi cotransporter family protein [Clostridia bacterium]